MENHAHLNRASAFGGRRNRRDGRSRFQVSGRPIAPRPSGLPLRIDRLKIVPIWKKRNISRRRRLDSAANLAPTALNENSILADDFEEDVKSRPKSNRYPCDCMHLRDDRPV